MDCPVCGVELRTAERHGIEIDYCPRHRGIWLDRGELEKIIERSLATFAPSDPEGRSHERQKAGDAGDEQDVKQERGGFLEDLLDL